MKNIIGLLFMEKILYKIKKLNLLRSTDIQFAKMISKNFQPEILLTSAVLSYESSNYHTYLPLSLLSSKFLFNKKFSLLIKKSLKISDNISINKWKNSLIKSNAISNGSKITPLILDNNNLYLRRIWENEFKIINFFNKLLKNFKYEIKNIKNILSRDLLINKNLSNIWKNIFIAIEIVNPILIVSENIKIYQSYIINKLIKVILSIQDVYNKNIILVTFDEFTTINLKKIFDKILNKFKLNEYQKNLFKYKIITLNNLLKMNNNRQKLYYHQNTNLDIDILIIYKASMINLQIMSDIISIISLNTKLIFLGNYFNLSSIKFGSIFNDLLKIYKNNNNLCKFKKLFNLINLKLLNKLKNKNIFNNIFLLKENYYLYKKSNFFNILTYINKENSNKVLSILNNNKKNKNINYIVVNTIVKYKKMLRDFVKNYSLYFKDIYHKNNKLNILKLFFNFRILCATKYGYFGTYNLNKFIEINLIKDGFIVKNNNNKYYLGKLILIVEDSLSLGIFNGDLGIILFDENKNLCAKFLTLNNNIKTISLNLLPNNKTAFAITIYQAQELKFYNTAIILPNNFSSELSKELLYSAINCTKNKIFLYANNKIIRFTVTSSIKKRNNILNKFNKINYI